jgi:hypothetical protein
MRRRRLWKRWRACLVASDDADVDAAFWTERDVRLQAYGFFEATVRKLKRRAKVFEFPALCRFR